VIQGHGLSGAPIIFIADGAAGEDIQTGYAISGRAEQTYRRYCKDANLSYDNAWHTALIKDRINLNVPEANRELVTDAYKTILFNEIKSIRPRVIVPLSELAFEFTTGLRGIRKFRGSVLPSRADFLGEPVRVVPILGLYPYLNEQPKQHFITRIDFAKLPKALAQYGPIKEVGHVWICKSAAALREYIERQYEQSSFLTFDIETFAGIPTCISICFDGREACTVPLIDSRFSLDERSLLAHLVAKLLASPKAKVNQNVKFDWRKLERFNFRVANVAGDTMIAAGILYPEFPKNLGFLTSIYTEMPYFKDEGKDFNPESNRRDQLYLYCAKDALATHIIYTKQQEEIEELNVQFVYHSTIALLPLYKRIEEVGIRIDVEARDSLRAKYQSRFDIQAYKLKSLTNHRDLNPLSPTQLRKIVFEELGYSAVKGVRTTKKGTLSVDEDTLELLLWQSTPKNCNPILGRDILKTIIACRKLHKVLEYIMTPLHPDGRMHQETNLVGTDTGRTSASSSSDYLIVATKDGTKLVNPGRSFQTIGKHGFELEGETLGKDMRKMFVPSRGYRFVECDLSGAEARVDAVLANDFDILAVFDTPTGIHRLTGSWVYNCPPEEIKKGVLVGGVDRYLTSKVVRHSAERNIKEQQLMLMIHQPISECIKLLARIHERQPNIRGVFHRDIIHQLKTHHCLVAPNGRRRDFFGRFDQDQINAAISDLPQGIVSDQLKFSLPATFEECDWARPLVEAHDGFLAEVPVGREHEYARVFKRNVEARPIDFRKCSLSRDFQLVIPCEAESGDNWKEMKELIL
jgi:uracil-DNA glycosylase